MIKTRIGEKGTGPDGPWQRGCERAPDMPEDRQLEGAAGPSDGLGGKWCVVLLPASAVVGGDIPPAV